MGNRYIKKNLLFLFITFLSCSLYAQRYKVRIEVGVPLLNPVSGDYGSIGFRGRNDDPGGRIRSADGDNRFILTAGEDNVFFGFTDIRDRQAHTELPNDFASLNLDYSKLGNNLIYAQGFTQHLGLSQPEYQQFNNVVYDENCVEFTTRGFYDDNNDDVLLPTPREDNIRTAVGTSLGLTFVDREERLVDMRPGVRSPIAANDPITESFPFEIQSGTQMNMMEVRLTDGSDDEDAWKTMTFRGFGGDVRSTWRLSDFFTAEELNEYNVIFRGVVCVSSFWPQEERVYTIDNEDVALLSISLGPSTGFSDTVIVTDNASCSDASDGAAFLAFEDHPNPIDPGLSIRMTLNRIVYNPSGLNTTQPVEDFIINNEDLFDDYHYALNDLAPGVYFTSHFDVDIDDIEAARGRVVNSDVFRIRGPEPLTLEAETEQPLCAGATGSVVLIASGGRVLNASSNDELIDSDTDFLTFRRANGVYQFSLEGTTVDGEDVFRGFISESDTSDTFTFDGLDPGTYEVTARLHVDGLASCESDSQTVTINVPVSDFMFDPVIYDPDLSETKASSPTANDGAIIVFFQNGVPPFTPSITNLDTGEQTVLTTGNYNTPREVEFTGLVAGRYDILLEDANGCQISYEDVLLTSEDLPIIDNVSIEADIDCFDGNTGVLEVMASGGTTNYGYQWTKAGDPGFLRSTARITNLTRGTYTVRVINFGSGDFNNLDTFVSETAVIGSGVSEIVINNVDTQDAVCFEDSGSITVDVSGGESPYRYRIGTGNFIALPVSNIIEVTSAISNRSFTIRDANNCEVEYPNLISVSRPQNALTITLEDQTNNNVTGASEGSIVLQVLGGNENNSALLYDFVVTRDSSPFTPTITYSVPDGEHTISNLLAGTYIISVTDDGGCSEVLIDPVIITDPEPLMIGAISPSSPINCNGDTGTLQVVATGGSETYTYEWTLGATTLADTDNLLENAVPGTYTVTVNDGFTTVTSLSYELINPEPVSFTAVKTDATCNDVSNGIIAINPQGGNGFYEYSIDDRETYNELIGPAFIIPELAVGVYTIWIRDTNDCEAAASQTRTIEEPEAIVITEISNTPIEIRGENTGSLEASVDGGTGVLTSVWTRSLDDSFIETTLLIENLFADTYTLTVTDANGCEESTTFEVIQPETLSVEIEETLPVACNGGLTAILTAVASGGFPLEATPIDYSYAWERIADNDESTSLLSGAGQDILDDIGAGRYRVTITDSKGETAFTTFIVEEPEALAIDVVNTIDINCFGNENGAIEVAITGGPTDEQGNFMDYSFEWTKEGDPQFIATTQNIEGLTPGFYNLEVTDANLCRINTSTPIEIVGITSPLTITEVSRNVSTGVNNADGSIDVTVSGGTEPYTFNWTLDNDPTFSQTTEDISGLLRGLYTLQVIDANGCEEDYAGRIAIPGELVIDRFQAIDPICYNACTGAINIEIAGGLAPFTYLWSNGATSQNLENLCPGEEYTVMVTDALNGTTSMTIGINNALPFEVDLGPDITLCSEQSISFDATHISGVAYRWSSTNGFESTGPTITVTETGIYTVEVFNEDNCVATDDVFVEATSNVISANFIAASQVFVNENFVIVNVADPKPDSIDWEIPDAARIIAIDDSHVELSFAQPGTYQVTLGVNLGLCYEELTKEIVVFENELEGENEQSSVDIRTSISYELYPNPATQGEFHLAIDASTEVGLNISVYHPANNNVLIQRSVVPKLEHLEDFDISGLPSGLYFVIVESNLGDQVLKLIID